MSDMPTMKAGQMKSVMLKVKPADIIHAVSVVPMLAPIMTLMACASVRSPAFTNETVITVVAVLLCTAAVTVIPVRIPVRRFVVIRPKMCRNCGPAIFCNASLICFIPNISSANDPSSRKTNITISPFVSLIIILFFRCLFVLQSYAIPVAS